MCGILFSKSNRGLVDTNKFKQALGKQEWRGPDATGVSVEVGGVHLGHVRLSILDISGRSNQPMQSSSGQYKIIYNGEIYNHLQIRENLGLKCKTLSDTETVLEAFCAIGIKAFELFDGMFSFVIYDVVSGKWWAARDRFGIKPLFMYDRNGSTFVSSETVSIRHLASCTVSDESLDEWAVIRRPIPGATFFNEISEVLPGSVICEGKFLFKMRLATECDENTYDDAMLQDLVRESVQMHELSDVKNVCLLSGGIDSSIITALSSCDRAYTVGLRGNNEIREASETAVLLSKELKSLELEPTDLLNAWKHLIKLRGEPLSVPNEGLIYLICNSMQADEKVVLTGEGADEVFFGYDRIYRAAAFANDEINLDSFYELYGYAPRQNASKRLDAFVENMMVGKDSIDFVEDFFLEVHLTGLLRRMDMSSMAASKEARVPFVTQKLINYMYRRPATLRLDHKFSKIPLRNMCNNLGMPGPVNRKKIGFSSTFGGVKNRFDEYSNFRNLNLEALQWL